MTAPAKKGQDLFGSDNAPGIAYKAEAVDRSSIITLLLLMLTYACVSVDRTIMSILLEPIKKEFLLSDTQLGFLPLAFALLFAFAGIPLGVIGDRSNRRNLAAACMAFFSAMTVLCGMAQNYVQLLLARFGVGAGEAGCGPAALSMIADLFPPRRRATAMSVYYIAAPLGTILTFTVGGYLSAHYGWRTALVAAGIPGLLLAVVLLAFGKEPRRGAMDGVTAQQGLQVSSLKETLRFIWRQRALVHMVAAIAFMAIVSAGGLNWLASFLVRSHGLSMSQAGFLVGIYFGVVSMAGLLCGGYLTDRLARRDSKRRTLILALSALISMPMMVGMLLVPGETAMVAFMSLWSFALFIWYGPGYALCQSLVRPHMRSTLASVIYLLTNLIGVGLASQIVGLLSDALKQSQGADSLRYALVALSIGLLAAAFHFYRAGRTVAADLEYAVAPEQVR